MSPAELSWLQGCLFLFLGIAGSVATTYSLNWCQNCRTKRGTSHVELSSIHVENGIATTPSDDAQSSGRDEEARSPSNLSNPVGEAMASTGPPSWPERNRRRSRRHPRSASVADMTPRSMSSTAVGLLRPSGGEDEALSLSDPDGEDMALRRTLSFRDRKRRRSNSCTRMNAHEERTKSSFEKFMAKDESRNVGKPEPANMIVTDSSSTSMGSTTVVRRRLPRRQATESDAPLLESLKALTTLNLRPMSVLNLPPGSPLLGSLKALKVHPVSVLVPPGF